jgi:hypothetical protein
MIPSTPRSFARRGAEVHVRVLALGVRRREHRGMYLFDQVDFGGEAGPPESVLGHHIALQGHPA